MDWELVIGDIDGFTNGQFRNYRWPFRRIPLLRRIKIHRRHPTIHIGNWDKMAKGEWTNYDGTTPEEHATKPWETVIATLNHEELHRVLLKLLGGAIPVPGIPGAWSCPCTALDFIIHNFKHEDKLGLPDFHFLSELQEVCPDYAGDFHVVDDVSRGQESLAVSRTDTFNNHETQGIVVEA